MTEYCLECFNKIENKNYKKDMSYWDMIYAKAVEYGRNVLSQLKGTPIKYLYGGYK